jgi:twinkle protein
MSEAQFVQHEPCPKCGSEDNLARYDDGHGYCFGCEH